MTTPINDQNEALRRELADVRAQLATAVMCRDEYISDARRFNALRRISQCRDEAKVRKLNQVLERIDELGEEPTVEQFDAFFDAAVIIVDSVLGAE